MIPRAKARAKESSETGPEARLLVAAKAGVRARARVRIRAPDHVGLHLLALLITKAGEYVGSTNRGAAQKEQHAYSHMQLPPLRSLEQVALTSLP